MNYKWPLINDNVSEQDRKVLSDFILSNQRLTNGNKVREFENMWSKWLGVKHSVMINSGNSGNVGISILPKSTSGILTVDGKSGIGGPALTSYEFQVIIAVAGMAGGGAVTFLIIGRKTPKNR